MRIERSPMRKRERDQCVSEIRTNENREKSCEVRERDQCVSGIRSNENREKSHEEEGKRSVCK
jgi:hypothetical protein